MRENDSNYQEWVRRAEDDWQAIAAIVAPPSRLWEIAAFHAQQCAEKYLKAFLVHNGWLLKKTHELVDLLSDAVAYDPSLGGLISDCQQLNPFILSGRYPTVRVSEQQCRSAITAAGNVRDEIRKRLLNDA